MIKQNIIVLPKDVKIFEYTVPAGFMTDYASIPFPFNHLWVYNNSSAYNVAALIHDYCFIYKQIIRDGAQVKVNYWEANYLYLQIMRRLGERRRNAWPIFLAVLLFSWVYW